jgi:hypothetical protein
MNNASIRDNKKQPLIRIDAADKAVLESLAAQTGVSAPRLLHRALTKLKKDIFFDQLNRGYSNLKQDPESWKQEESDRTLFDSAVSDGLSGLK